MEQVRKQETVITKEKLDAERDKTKSAREKAKEAKEQSRILALALLEKGVELESIAKIMEITPKAVKQLSRLLVTI